MQTVLNTAFLLASEANTAAHGESASHADAILIGAIIFGALALLMIVTASFSNVAHRHPETPARMDPHRIVHARPGKH